jgi:DNA-binding HxlR family transcriptional regulator
MAKDYGQFCPVAKAAELFCERWTPLIIRDLAWGAVRFSELQRGVPLMSPTLLSQRLKQLEAEGIVERRLLPDGRTQGYYLTEAGAEFAPVVQALGVWGQRWSRRELEEGEIDLGLLIWAMERSVKADAFGPDRAVVRLELTDQPEATRFWWFVNEKGAVQLCLEDPGFEVGLYLAAALPDMIYVMRGDIALPRALESGSLEAIGTDHMRRALPAWFNLHPLTEIESRRPGMAALGMNRRASANGG